MSQHRQGSWRVPPWFYLVAIPFAPLLIIVAAFICLVMSFTFGSEVAKATDDADGGDVRAD